MEEIRKYPNMAGATSAEIACEMVRILDEKKGEDIKLFHVEAHTVVTDYYVLATGRSNTHIRALCDDLAEEMERRCVSPFHIEGKDGGAWILLDYGSVIVHLFDATSRAYYHLERLQPEDSEVDVKEIFCR